jgi:hypothetical protein
MKRKHNPIVDPPNPIVDTAKRGVKKGVERELLVLLGRWDERRPEEQLDIVRRVFTDQAIKEIGSLILGALVAGDKQMPRMVGDAIKEADHMFGRDRELDLLLPALRYRLLHWDEILLKNRGHLQRAVDDLKKGIEQHCNNGQTLAPHRWQRLRLALRLPKKSSVRSDRKAVKLGEVGEIIDLASPLAKKRQSLNRANAEAFYRDHYHEWSPLRRRWAEILLDMVASRNGKRAGGLYCVRGNNGRFTLVAADSRRDAQHKAAELGGPASFSAVHLLGAKPVGETAAIIERRRKKVKHGTA